jgi:hypothetical protein
MIMLTGLLGFMAVACSWSEIQRHVGFFHLNLLWSLGGVIGVFLAIDMFLFFFFWEMMLVPVYFLIALWGHSGSGRQEPDLCGHQVLHFYPGRRPDHAGRYPCAGLHQLLANPGAELRLPRTCWVRRWLRMWKWPADAVFLHGVCREVAGGAVPFLAAGRPRPGTYRR